MLLSQQLTQVAAKNRTKAALHYLEKDIPYSELITRIARLSYLYMNEIQHNKCVGFLTRNSPSVVTTFFALTNTCSSVVPLDPDLAPDVLTEWIKEAKCTHIAVTNDLLSFARELLSHAHLQLPILEIERKQGGEYDTSFIAPSEHTPKDKDPVILFRTQGITGKPKLCVFNHLQLHHAAINVRGLYKLLPTDRVHTQLNWAHPYAWIHNMMVPLFGGATCLIDHGMKGVEYLDSLVKAKPTRLITTPPLARELLSTLQQTERKLAGIKSVTLSLGNLSETEKQRFKEMGIKPLHCYGQTEAGWTLAMEPFEGESHLPSGMKAKVLDLAGDEVPFKKDKPKRHGHFAVSGPSLMSKYLGLEKETKNALRGTWLYTGSYAEISGPEDQTQVRFLGRKDELIIDKAGEIQTAAVYDEALKGLLGAVESAAFPLLTGMGEAIWAIAVVKEEKSLLTDATVLEHVRMKLANQVVPMPRIVTFTDHIPKDKGGNVNRIRLKNQFSGIAG